MVPAAPRAITASSQPAAGYPDPAMTAPAMAGPVNPPRLSMTLRRAASDPREPGSEATTRLLRPTSVMPTVAPCTTASTVKRASLRIGVVHTLIKAQTTQAAG